MQKIHKVSFNFKICMLCMIIMVTLLIVNSEFGQLFWACGDMSLSLCLQFTLSCTKTVKLFLLHFIVYTSWDIFKVIDSVYFNHSHHVEAPALS